MINSIIDWSIRNRVLVLLLTVMLAGWGVYAVQHTPLDAIPDLSDVQVIIKTSYPGQAPRVIEDQITYPLTTAMLSVPKAVTVRGYSMFGDSYVYVIFEDGTDIYWARSRVLEYLSQVSSRLPATAKPELGPDATGVGWVYEYALVDKTGQHDLAQLRSLQDWYLKFELQTVDGVSEVATIGGMVKQYQIVIEPNRLRAFGLTLAEVRNAVQRANQEVGGSVIEMAEAEYMVRVTGYLSSDENLRHIPLGINDNGAPILLKDVAEVRIGPELRRGIAELNGEGEVVGGVVVMRWGGNARATIEKIKQKLATLKQGLPAGVEIVETYDRSALINRAVDNLSSKLIEELLLVAVVCAVFLMHLRSALVALVVLPMGILMAFIVMYYQGINANIMSLGGIAIAMGVMVDAAIVMIENVHKHMERDAMTAENRWQIIRQATAEVGPPVFFSLLIITISFLPVFTLEAQEGRMFAPLAYTKTYAMAAAALLTITLIPVLIGYFIRGKMQPEQANPINRFLIRSYRPLIDWSLRAPWQVLGMCAALLVLSIYPVTQLGSEFMPDLDEGDLLYMPTTFPGISVGKAQELLQQTDKLIRTVPEVKSVFGKIGRADTATDPAPLTMVETTIQLKPHSEWRNGMTIEKLKQELNSLVQFPGITNAWVMPIKTRIDMLATGIKTPVGIKVSGPDLAVIENLGKQIEQIIKTVPGTASAYSERVAGGRYVIVEINRRTAARFGLNVVDVQDVILSAVGGMNVTETVEGLERYPVNIRYPQDLRDSLEELRQLPIVTPIGAQIALAEVADVRIESGPAMIQSENARPNGWIYVDIANRDVGSYVADAQQRVAEQVQLPTGYAINWSGQFEYMLRAKQKLLLVVPLTLALIVLLLYLNFRNFSQVMMIMAALPLAIMGGFWLLYFLHYNLSVAVWVGFIALAGLATEIGVVKLVYLNHAYDEVVAQAQREQRALTLDDIHRAIIKGALQRVRPVAMTAATILAGLLPIMLGTGTGSEVMRRIAAPIVGGVSSSVLLIMIVLPAMFLIWKRRALQK